MTLLKKSDYNHAVGLAYPFGTVIKYANIIPINTFVSDGLSLHREVLIDYALLWLITVNASSILKGRKCKPQLH